MQNPPQASAVNVDLLRFAASLCSQYWQQQQYSRLSGPDEYEDRLRCQLTCQFIELSLRIYLHQTRLVHYFDRFLFLNPHCFGNTALTLEVNFQYFETLFKRKATQFVPRRFYTEVLPLSFQLEIVKSVLK